jgi:outer membrane protein assembly factor BamB
MNRRTFLALTGSSLAVSIAGCLQEFASSEQPPVNTESEFGQFQYDALNTGVTGTSAPTNPESRWKQTFDTGVVGIAATDDLIVVTTNRKVYGLHRDGGTEQWSVEVGQSVGYPAVSADTAYVPVHNGPPFQDRGIVAIHLNDGNERWRAAPDVDFRSPLTLRGNTIYAAGDGLVAIDATDGSKRWSLDSGTFGYISAVDNGTVYIGGGQSSTIRAITAESGEEVWQVKTEGEVTVAPTVSNDTVYVPSEHGRLYVLAADDGREQWTADLSVIADESIPEDAEPVTRLPYRSDWIVPTSVAATSETVYATINTAIIALNNDGEHLWSQPGGSEHPPVKAGDSLLVSSENAVCLDPESGEKLWEFPIERRIFSDTTADGVGCHPVVINDTMYVGANGGYVYALEDKNQ